MYATSERPVLNDRVGIFAGSSTFLPANSNGWPIGTSYASASCDRFLRTSRMVNQICRPTSTSDLAFTSQYIENQLVNQQVNDIWSLMPVIRQSCARHAFNDCELLLCRHLCSSSLGRTTGVAARVESARV